MNEDLKRWDEEAVVWSEKTLQKRPIVEYLVQPEYLKLFGDINNLRILDAGCGEGIMSGFLSKHGAKVIGIDGSQKMIEYAKVRYPGIEFHVADLLEPIDLPDNSFDGILSSFVVMSLAQLDIFLSECHRLLRTDGALVVAAFHPAFNNPTMQIHRSLWAKLLNKPAIGIARSYFNKTKERKDVNGNKPWPFYHRTIEQYVDLFRKYKFGIERITEPHEMPPDVVAEYRMYYATRLPRFIFFKLTKQ